MYPVTPPESTQSKQNKQQSRPWGNQICVRMKDKSIVASGSLDNFLGSSRRDLSGCDEDDEHVRLELVTVLLEKMHFRRAPPLLKK
jgi:hypothetical protein